MGADHGQVVRFLNVINNVKSNKDNLFVAEGLWLCKNVIDTDTPVETVILLPEKIHTPDGIALAEEMISRAETVGIVSEKVYNRINEIESEKGIAALCKLPDYHLDTIQITKKTVLLILDGLEIPGNVGTIIRTADGAGITAVVICNKRTRMNHPKVIRSSQCTILNLPVIEANMEELQSWLQSKKFTFYFADTEAKESYSDVQYADKTAVIMGSERYGIHKKWYDLPHVGVFIPMLGKADSLNVGVATSIIAYEVRNQFDKKV